MGTSKWSPMQPNWSKVDPQVHLNASEKVAAKAIDNMEINKINEHFRYSVCAPCQPIICAHTIFRWTNLCYSLAINGPQYTPTTATFNHFAKRPFIANWIQYFFSDGNGKLDVNTHL